MFFIKKYIQITYLYPIYVMKKRIIYIIIIIQISATQALSQQNVYDIVDAFEKVEQNQEQRIQNLTSFDNILTIAYQKVQSHIRPTITIVQQEVQNRLEWNQTTTQNQFPLTTQKWLDLHNSVRDNPVSIHPDLVRSAQIWATHLSENNIKSWTHKRDRSQTNSYNYSQIEGRFKDLGISFTSINGRSFSENIAYNTVKCVTQNCDKELVAATDKSRTFFYDREKPYNWSHYRAIMQENFQYIGVGIAIKNWRYHIVIHYGTQIQSPDQQLTQK